MRAPLLLVVVALHVSAISGCATPRVVSGTQEEDPCPGLLDNVLRAETGEFCDPVLIESFEEQYMEWRELCIRVTLIDQREEAEEKLRFARACAEEVGRTALLKERCKQRVDGAAKGGDCFARACEPELGLVDEIIAECSAPEIDSPHVVRAERLRAKLKERVDEHARFEALDELGGACDRIAQIAGQDSAAAWESMLIEVLGDSPLLEQAPRGPEVQEFWDATLMRCVEAVTAAVGGRAADLTAELAQMQTKRQRKKARRLKRDVKRMVERLESTAAIALFPGAAEPMHDFLGGKKKGSAKVDVPPPPPKAEEPPPPPKVEEPPPAAEAKVEEPPPAVGSKLKELAPAAEAPSAKRCAKLRKDVQRFEGKIAQYQKKGNKKKVAAYQRNLDKAQAEVASCPSK